MARPLPRRFSAVPLGVWDPVIPLLNGTVIDNATTMIDKVMDDPVFAQDVPVDAIPALLEKLGALEARVNTARTVLAVRLAAEPVRKPSVTRTNSDNVHHLSQQEASSVSGIPLRTIRFLTRTGRVPSLWGRPRRLLLADLYAHL